MTLKYIIIYFNQEKHPCPVALNSLLLSFLNEDKTKVNVFGPNENSQGINPDLGSHSAFKSPGVQNLDVLVDQPLKFDKHISSVISYSLYQLRLLSKIKGFLI